jgi:transcriptional regulator with XRE-family HTH domain
LDARFLLRFSIGKEIPIIQLFWLFFHELSVFMSGKKTTLLPGPEKILTELGVNLKLARKRRKLSRDLVADRAGIARSTLQLIEDGNPGVAMSSYLQVLFLLGLEKDLLRGLGSFIVCMVKRVKKSPEIERVFMKIRDFHWDVDFIDTPIKRTNTDSSVAIGPF